MLWLCTGDEESRRWRSQGQEEAMARDVVNRGKKQDGDRQWRAEEELGLNAVDTWCQSVVGDNNDARSQGRLAALCREVLLEQLRNGTAQFELLPTPVPLSAPDVRFFARIGSSLGGGVSPATKKVERYAVHKVTGDGRCMFRALVKGMANYKGLALSLRQEKDDADELRMAVKEIICDNETERRQYEEALIAITVDESLKQYCQRIGRSDFWGGESELLVNLLNPLSFF
ncbi:hypothetical protein ZIOFF_013892 [Zingiber officinale]|uniref:Ubiquitin thioesterase OTU n=1 Tax=Zingiber officinale TaxID=94328 RepID=A0A8J5HCA6_ZINOF|nr:hypothetical protein ZIOFF_013892 [Zingiber officinale]